MTDEKFVGMLLRESLRDQSPLEALTVTRAETWSVDDHADFQPDVWNAVWFEGDADSCDAVVEAIRVAMKPRWYANVSLAGQEIVVFSDRVFHYVRGDAAGKAFAQQHGRSLGIPERQIDWG